MNYEEARVYLEEASKSGKSPGQFEVYPYFRNQRKGFRAGLSFYHTDGGGIPGGTVYFPYFVFLQRADTGKRRADRKRSPGETCDSSIKDMEEHHLTNPTPFEIETALSFLYFQEKKCDLVVLETGLGGALDATNIIKTPVMEVITPISMDHMAFLGDTLEEIAAQKAGIIKPYTKVVSGPQEDGARKVLEERAKEQGASLEFLDMEEVKDIHYGYEKQSFTWRDFDQVEISLAGSYQILNAALALQSVTMLQELGYSVSRENIYEGFRKTHWRGRFTLISKEPVVIMDGAHNPGAARELEHSLKLYFPHRHIRYIFGIFQDKDYKQVIQITAPLADHIITVQTPDNPRALPAEELKEAVACVNPFVEAAKSIEQAVEKTLEEAKPEDVVIIFGSLSFLGEAERNVKKWKEKQDGLQ